MWKLLYLCSLLGALSASAQSSEDFKMDALAKVITSSAAYNESLAALVTAYGESQLNEALRVKNLALADEIRARLAALEYEFSRVKVSDAEVSHTLVKLSTRYNNVNYYFRRGKMEPAAVDGFFDLTLSLLPAKIGHEILFVAVPELPAEDFVPNRVNGERKRFPGGKAGQFVRFLVQNELSVELYSGAHEHLFKLVVLLQDSTNRYVQQVEAQRVLTRASVAESFWKYPTTTP